MSTGTPVLFPRSILLTTSSRKRTVLGLVAVTVLLPLAATLLGLWEQSRSVADLGDLKAERLRVERIVAALDAHTPTSGRLDMGMQFRWGGQAYVGPLALAKAREALADVERTVLVARARDVLPPVVVVSSGLAAGLSLLILAVGAVLGRAGRASRDALVRGFSLVRLLLPAALGAQVLLATVAFVAAMTFEVGALLRPGAISTGEIKLLAIAGIAVLGSLWVAGSTVIQLRRTLAAFEPDPLPVLGRVVAPEEAPGLWRLLDSLAGRLGALRPDHVVVGLTEGFFVSSGAKVLEPGGQAMTGRTLYLPLPVLPLLRPDEVVSIIAHELAHFSGRDTDYSLRFLPIYVGVGRSLDAVASGGIDGRGAGSPLLMPALQLGTFVMDQFHHAVRHWNRQREFAADAAGAGITSPEEAARALLRTAALQPRIARMLEAAIEAPETAPEDLVAGLFRDVAARGLDDPSAHLEEAQPHPTDTHSPTRQRLDALGCPPTPGLLARATAPPSTDLQSLRAYFADPSTLCRMATADFLGAVRRDAAAYHARLEAMVAEVGAEERVLREGTRAGGLVVAIGGGLVTLALLALALFGLPGISLGEGRFVAATVSPLAVALVAYGAFVLRRGERPFLVLRPETLMVPGLDRSIPWDDVADLDLSLRNRRVAMRLLLPPAAGFPRRAAGRRVKLDAARRIVTVRAVLPHSMKPQTFADLIGRYRMAAAARRQLADAQAHAPVAIPAAPG